MRLTVSTQGWSALQAAVFMPSEATPPAMSAMG
jgi:hypothetical protein